MKKFIKAAKWTSLVIVILVLFIYFRPAWTPPITSHKGKESIASLERIELGDLKQSVLIRSEDSTNPILLFLHGGPGMPLMYLAHTFQRPLEKEFTVVHWDQRGAGKSYNPDIAIETIHVEQYLADAIQLIDTLRYRFDQPKIFLVGHSWGTYLGSILVNRHPDLFYAYISAGQVVDDKVAVEIQKEFLFKEATVNKDTLLLNKLSQPDFVYLEDYLFKYGGELKYATSFTPLVLSGLRATEYTFRDALNVAKGPQFCGRHMRYNAIDGSIMDNIREYEVPVFFLTGTRDYTTPFSLVEAYHDSIQAPHKEIIWFEESAHFPFYEEPGQFDSVLINVVLKIGNSGII